MKSFKQYLLEQTNNTFPLDSFRGKYIFYVRKPFIDKWYEFLVLEDWIKKDGKIFYAEPNPDNELEQKAFEFANLKHDSVVYPPGEKLFNQWVEKNVEIDRFKELGYDLKMFDYSTNNIFKKFYNCPLTIPHQPKGVTRRTLNDTLYSKAELFSKKEKLAFADPFRDPKHGFRWSGVSFNVFLDNCREQNVYEFKEYKKYNLDTETEETWREIAIGL